MLSAALALGLLAFSPSSGPAQTVTELQLFTNDLIYDPVSERIYASIPSIEGPGLGNTVTAIDPVTAEIEYSVFVGSEPGPLAVSDDGKYLYVGLRSAGAIQRFDIATATPGLLIDLGIDPNRGFRYAEDIEVLPGSPESIAVTLRASGISGSDRVAVYDNDVMRPTVLGNVVNRIEFSGTASTLYGFDGLSTDHSFQTIDVGPAGLTVVGRVPDLFNFPLRVGQLRDIEFEDGVIYATSGDVIDPAVPSNIGRFGVPTPSAVEPDAGQGRVYFIEGSTLKTFDMATFVLLETLPVDGVSGFPTSLIRWGIDGLAFRTLSGQVFLVSQIPPPSKPVCDVALNQTVFVDGETIVLSRLRLANPGSRLPIVEAKLWLEVAGLDPIALFGADPGQQLGLPPGYDEDFGPITLSAVSADFPRGNYRLNCQLIDAVSGKSMALDVNAFEIQ